MSAECPATPLWTWSSTLLWLQTRQQLLFCCSCWFTTFFSSNPVIYTINYYHYSYHYFFHHYYCSSHATYCYYNAHNYNSPNLVQHSKTQRQYTVCVITHIHTDMARSFAISVSQRDGEGEEGAHARTTGQLYKRQLASRVMGWAAVSAIRPSFAPSDPCCPHPHPPLPFHLRLYGIICIWHWLCYFLLRSFLSPLCGSHDNNKSSLLLDKDDLFSLSNQAITGWVHTQRTVLSLLLFICVYQLNEWVVPGHAQTALELGKNTNTPWFLCRKVTHTHTHTHVYACYQSNL